MKADAVPPSVSSPVPPITIKKTQSMEIALPFPEESKYAGPTYTIIKEIADCKITLMHDYSEGGCSQLVLARYHDTRVLIKISIKSPKLGNKGVYAVEVDTLARFSHPHILRPFGVTLNAFGKGKPGIVLPLMPKGDLEDIVSEEELSFPVCFRIAFEIADALEEVHAKGIVHKDIKASNILLDHNYHVRLADFGLAADAGDQDDHRGTKGWMAPERFVSESKVDFSSDVYAFGIVLLQLVPNSEAIIDVYVASDKNMAALPSSTPEETGVALAIKKLKDEKSHASDLSSPDEQMYLKGLVELAEACTQTDAKARPSMTDVKKKLAPYLTRPDAFMPPKLAKRKMLLSELIVKEEEWLTIPRRIQIALKVANLLKYFHHHGCIHQNLKIANIAVDDADNVAFTNLDKTEVVDDWTLAPEKHWPTRGKKTSPDEKKSNIYHLGIILLALILKQYEFDAFKKCLNQNEINILVLEGFIKGFNQKYSNHQLIVGFMAVVFNCLQADPKKRPSINEVVYRLTLLTNDFSLEKVKQTCSAEIKTYVDNRIARKTSGMFGCFFSMNSDKKIKDSRRILNLLDGKSEATSLANNHMLLLGNNTETVGKIISPYVRMGIFAPPPPPQADLKQQHAANPRLSMSSTRSND